MSQYNLCGKTKINFSEYLKIFLLVIPIMLQKNAFFKVPLFQLFTTAQVWSGLLFKEEN